MSQGLLKLVLKTWDSAREDVKAATAAARRLRFVAIISIVISAVCIFVCIYQSTLIQRQGGSIAAMRGEIESIHKLLDAGVVIEEAAITVEETITN